MKSITYALLTTALIGNVYASIQAIKSYSRFNKCIKVIDCYELRQDVKHLAEAIELRQS